MTENSGLHVIIAGGGLGGLALAAGLLRAGVTTTVLERDTDLAATGGYHIHLDGEAVAALRGLLDPRDFERLLASSASSRLQGGDITRDMRGRVLSRTRSPQDLSGINIDRITLRLILASAVGPALETGVSVRAFTRREDGTVEVALADGSTRHGDVLVGAEGVGSPIAQQLAGGPTTVPTGLLGIGGRTRVDRLPEEVRRHLGADSGLAVGPSGTGLYIGYHDPVGQAAVDNPALASPVTTTPTFIWGAVLSESSETEALRGLAGAELRDATIAFLRRKSWGGRMLAVLRETELEGIATFRFHAGPADPHLIAPWAAGRVTALGDGVHAMPPTAGMGAATAIQDAARLAAGLRAARDGSTTVSDAVRDYEDDMRVRAARAIRASLRPVGWIHATNRPVGALVARLALPLLAAVGRAGARR